MSHINLYDDNSQTPRPPAEIKLESVRVAPYPDRFRIFIEVKVTPFLERPNLILVLKDKAGNLINELNIIATMHTTMEFTMHIRNVDDPAGDYILYTELFYESRNPPQDTAETIFTIPTESDNA